MMKPLNNGTTATSEINKDLVKDFAKKATSINYQKELVPTLTICGESPLWDVMMNSGY